VEYNINFNEILQLATEIWNVDVSAAQRKLFWSIDNRQNTYLTTAAKYVTVCVVAFVVVFFLVDFCSAAPPPILNLTSPYVAHQVFNR
jgi:hypothetical protein